MAGKGLPDAERLEEMHGAGEERDGAPVAPRIGRADQDRREAVPGERDRSAEAGRSGADDGDVEALVRERAQASTSS